MRRLAVVIAIAISGRAAAEVRCTGTPCVDSSGGFSSPVATDPVSATGAWTFDNAANTAITAADGIAVPSAGAANAVQMGETAGCITFEVSADANETRLCATEFADSTFNLPGSAVNTGTYTLLANQATQIAYMGAFAVTSDTSTNAYILTGIGGFGMYKDAQVIWTSDAGTIVGGAALTNKDAGIARLGAARIKVTNGSTGSGGLQASQIVSPQITTYTTTADDSGTLITNTGDADGATITLMNNPTIGIWHDFAVTAAFAFTIQPSAGETLYLLDTACATISSPTVGGILHVVAATAGNGAIWVSQATGAWTCTP